MLGRVCEPEWLDILGEGGAVVGGLAVVGVVGVEGGRVTRGGLVPKLSVIIIRPVWMKLGMNWRHVAEADIVARRNAGQHGGHVVEQHLDGAHLGVPLMAGGARVKCWIWHWTGRCGGG